MQKKLNRRELIKRMGYAAMLPAMPLISSGKLAYAAGKNNAASNWASGGTAAMTAPYPPADPFSQDLGNLCSVTRSYTLGPCYFAPDDYREDISEGQPGVPMALVLKLVNARCEPVTGADIEVWYCNSKGFYSGNTATSSDASRFYSGFCTENDSSALQAKWFRGVATTDSNGLVHFKGCFPGWYRRRTTHIHFRVVHAGVQTLVSQFCFDDDLSNNIYVNHPDYTGQPKDTSNAEDRIFNRRTYKDYMFTVKRQPDNSMLAYKAIQIV